MPRRQPLPRFALVLLAVLVASGAFVGLAVGADPEEGTISLEERQASWTGKKYAVASTPAITCDAPELCDRFTLHVDVPASHWETSTGGAEVVIAWEDPADNFNMTVYDQNGKEVGSSAQTNTTSEKVLIENANSTDGPYEIVVNPRNVTDSGYNGGVLLESREDVAPGAGGVPTEPVSNLDCVDGKAGPFPCKGVDLDGFLPNSVLNGGEGEDEMGDPVELNDIWGWTDPVTGREYALVGKTTGTAFVDITQADAPRYLGSLPTAAPVLTLFKNWRDVKVYEDHAFIVSEEPSHGMQVFDLTRLRGVTEPQEWDEDARYTEFGNAHNVAINEGSGYAYAIGTATCGQGAHIVDIREPKTPRFAGCNAQDGYTHDTQCVNYDGPDERFAGREICFDSNEDTVTIADVTDTVAGLKVPKQISRTEYDGAQYTHQGWLTKDKRHFLVNDELDEQETGEPTTTRIFDVSKLDQPVLVGVYKAGVSSIDHNLYTKGDVVYEANYRSGLRVLDARRVAEGTLSELGFFDIYPQDDRAEFNGAWSNYPYFASGKVVVSGIEQGLFVLDPSAATATEQAGGGSAGGAGSGGGQTASDGGTTSSGGAASGQAGSPVRATIASRALRASRGRAVRVRVRCAAPAGSACPGRVRLRSGGRAIGKRAFSVPAGRTATVRVKLRRSAYRRLVRRGSLRTRVLAAVRTQEGLKRTSARRLVLRAP